MYRQPDSAAATEERVVYQAAFEALIRAVNADARPDLAAALLSECGYDMRRPRRAYPPETLLKVLDLLTARCFPDQPRDAAHQEFGRRAFNAYRTTVVGRVVLAALSLADVPRAMQVASRSFRAVSNYTTNEVIADGPQHLIFRVAHSVLTPPYMLGILGGLLAASGHPDVRVTFDASKAPEQTDFHLHW